MKSNTAQTVPAGIHSSVKDKVMFYRPKFVTNSSSSGYYFFIPQNQNISHEFFDEIGLTPIFADDGFKIDSLNLLRDFLRTEQEDKEAMAKLEASNSPHFKERLEEFSIPGLRASILEEVKWLIKDRGEKHGFSYYTKQRIRAYSKLLGAVKRGYRIVHIEYADDSGSYASAMDYHSGSVNILEKKGVGGVVTMNHH